MTFPGSIFIHNSCRLLIIGWTTHILSFKNLKHIKYHLRKGMNQSLIRRGWLSWIRLKNRNSSVETTDVDLPKLTWFMILSVPSILLSRMSQFIVFVSFRNLFKPRDIFCLNRGNQGAIVDHVMNQQLFFLDKTVIGEIIQNWTVNLVDKFVWAEIFLNST